MRLVCLSAEGADICARLGAWEDVVAVSAFASQEGLDPRPAISGFSTADAERIVRQQPDLVITFSDVQADISAQLIRAGCAVLATNQRTLAEIATTIRWIGSAIGRSTAAEALAAQFQDDLAALKSDATSRPRVYFEEWPDPLISGIGWVGELIEWCGGEDIFAARRGQASRERIVRADEIIAANPDIILASWCGKRVDLDSIRQRPGFHTITALHHGDLHALDSNLFLQPGPRVLDGARELHRLFTTWRSRQAEALAT